MKSSKGGNIHDFITFFLTLRMLIDIIRILFKGGNDNE